MSMANTLAYYNMATIMAVNFYGTSAGVDPITFLHNLVPLESQTIL